MNLTGKVALVTGGGRGIGRATALAFARAGADVAVNYLQNGETATAVVAAIREMGRKAVAIQGDVASKRDVDAMFAELDGTFGKLDILVNNAAKAGPTPLEQLELDFWDEILKVDLTGPFLCTKAAARRMIPQKYGRIVNISSISAVRGADMNAAYTSAKAGLLGFTKSAARYLGKHNITVNAICPGPTLTELSAALPAAAREGAARTSALGRIGTPEDVADAILFFASDYSRHVTGQMILVDGGMEMP